MYDLLVLLKKFIKNTFLYFIAVILRVFSFFFDVQSEKVVYVPVNFSFRGNSRFLLEKWINKSGYRHIFLFDGDIPEGIDVSKRVKFIKFGVLFLYHYATAGYIVRESEFNSVGLRPRKESKVVQLWHAAGAFKKFCLDISDRSEYLQGQRMKDIESWDLLLCSSSNLVDIYSGAFGGFSREKIFVGGLPRNDYLFHILARRDELREEYGIGLNEKVVLYAPTFRDKSNDFSIFLNFVDFLSKHLPADYKLGARLHPKIADQVVFSDCVLDFNACDVEEAMVIADILVTDYSSIIFDFALLDKLILFYSPDLSEYYDSRGFYFDFKCFVPGPIAETAEQLLFFLEKYCYDDFENELTMFKKQHNPYFDGKNSDRILKKILSL